MFIFGLSSQQVEARKRNGEFHAAPDVAASHRLNDVLQAIRGGVFSHDDPARYTGLDAIEAFYTEHSQYQTLEYLALARKLGLAVSGGSDYHGAAKPEVELGRGRGSLRVDIAVLDVLRARQARLLATGSSLAQKELDPGEHQV